VSSGVAALLQKSLSKNVAATTTTTTAAMIARKEGNDDDDLNKKMDKFSVNSPSSSCSLSPPPALDNSLLMAVDYHAIRAYSLRRLFSP